MAAPRSGLRAGLRAAFVLLASILFTAAAWGQTTSGSAAAGATVYAAQCTSCHTSPTNPYPAQQNGANAGFLIKAAVDAFMGPPSLTATQYADLGAYIASLLPAPGTQAVPFNLVAVTSCPIQVAAAMPLRNTASAST